MANKPNCGVFDELTRKCLACGLVAAHIQLLLDNKLHMTNFKPNEIKDIR